MDRMLNSRLEDLGFDSQCWPCEQLSGKLCNTLSLRPPSHNGYLVHRSSSCGLHWRPPYQGKKKVCCTCVVMKSGLETTTFTFAFLQAHGLLYTIVKTMTCDQALGHKPAELRYYCCIALYSWDSTMWICHRYAMTDQ